MPRAVGRECGTLFHTYNGLPRGRLTHEFMRCRSSSSSSSSRQRLIIIINITVIIRCRKQRRHGAALSAPAFSQPRMETRLFEEELLCATIRSKTPRRSAVTVLGKNRRVKSVASVVSPRSANFTVRAFGFLDDVQLEVIVLTRIIYHREQINL